MNRDLNIVSVTSVNGWELADDDTFQWVRKAPLMDNCFELIEMGLINPDTDEYLVYSDVIDLDDYVEVDCRQSDFLLSALSAFGYKEVEDVRIEYGCHANQIIAECIFEHGSCHEATHSFRGTEQECRCFINKWVAETP